MAYPPNNPAEWLLYLADLAERHRMVMITDAGNDLYAAFVTFLRSAGTAGAATLDLQADLLTMLPRFCNAVIQAEHGGDAAACGARFAGMIFNEIVQDQRELAARQKAERAH